MIYYYIDKVDHSSDISAGTLQITNQIQQRADSCKFESYNYKPGQSSEIEIYDGDTVASIASNVITLTGNFERNCNKFYAGQVLWLRPFASTTEKVTVQSYNESTLQVTLVAAPVNTTSNGDQIGELIFGGYVSNLADQNLQLLKNIVYPITAIDFSKFFDKRVVSGSWASVDCRYIINDFLNSTVNYNSTLDYFSYASNGALQAVWTASGDASAATIDTSTFLELTASAVLAWTHSGTTATWTGAITSKDVSDLTGASSGTPTKGKIALWVNAPDLTKFSTLKVRVGSSSSNYMEYDLTPTTSGDFTYLSANMKSGTKTGTPNWTALTYARIQVTESATSSIRVNGLRINDDTSFTMYNTKPSVSITNYRTQQLKTTAIMNALAQAMSFNWYIDYERDIHFKPFEAESAPYSLSDTSNNFNDLKISVDTSNIGNQVVVNGGEQTSTTTFSQVFAADGVLRVWITKNLFANLVMKVDDNTTTHSAEAGTTTTNIKITAHGLSTGDWIVNRTRSNAVRQITKVDANNFTVQTVASQTTSDTISYFAKTPTLGQEGLVDESTVDYVYNSDQKSIRASSQTTTLASGTYIQFAYNERTPIQFQYRDTASINRLKALGLGDGIYDLAPITDNTISDLSTAILTGKAKVNQFNNAIITGTFGTNQRGLRAGQIITVNFTTGRTLSDSYIIQKIVKKQLGGAYQDYIELSVTFATTLFGWVELMQKILKYQGTVTNLSSNEVIETFVTADEEVDMSESSAATKGGFKKATKAEVPTATDSNLILKVSGTWQWEPSSGQPLATRWDLFSWG